MTVQARTLQRAAEIVGGEEQLAIRLRVTPSHLALWIHGTELPPARVFLDAVDIVTEAEVQKQLAGRAASADTPAAPS